MPFVAASTVHVLTVDTTRSKLLPVMSGFFAVPGIRREWIQNQ
jgi:hypothetical protein